MGIFNFVNYPAYNGFQLLDDIGFTAPRETYTVAALNYWDENNNPITSDYCTLRIKANAKDIWIIRRGPEKYIGQCWVYGQMIIDKE